MMDITPKQFTAAVNALKWKLGRIVNHLQNLDRQISDIRDSGETQYKEWKANPPTFTAILNEPQTERDTRNTRESRRDQRDEGAAGRDRVRLAVEIFAMIITAILAGLTLASVNIARSAAETAAKSAAASEAQAKAAQSQTELAKRSAEESLEASRNEQRAWISPLSVAFTTQAGQPAGGGVRYANVGKTPAIDVFVGGKFNLLPQPITDIKGFLKSHPDALGNPIHLGVLFPGQTYEVGVKQKALLPPDVAQQFATGQLLIYVLGQMTYKDVFGRPHFTDICFLYQPNLKAFEACQFHNRAD